jgi:hypothetical protein
MTDFCNQRLLNVELIATKRLFIAKKYVLIFYLSYYMNWTKKNRELKKWKFKITQNFNEMQFIKWFINYLNKYYLSLRNNKNELQLCYHFNKIVRY